MKIGIFTDTYKPDINGVVTSIVTLQEALIDEGHDVYIITTKRGIISVTYEEQVLRVPGIEIKRMYGYKFTTPIQIRAYSYIKEMDLDIIHVHTEFGIGVLGHAVGKMLKIPIVSTYHTTYEDYTHYINTFNFLTVEKLAKRTIVRLSRLFGSSSTVIIAPSDKTKNMLVNYGIKREIVVLPTGLHLGKFSRSSMDLDTVTHYIHQTKLKSEHHVLVYVGRLAKEKSIQFIIDGIKEVSLHDENIKLVIVGSGPIEIVLKRQVRDLGIDNHVIFLGKIASESVPAVYHIADAFISASTTETQGLTYIEAMASGLPILARNDKVISDLVIDDETGYCFDDKETLVEAINKFFNLSTLEKIQMASNAKEKVQIFDRNNYAKNMIKVYERAQNIYALSYKVNRINKKDNLAVVELVNPDEKLELNLLSDHIEKRGIKEDNMIKKDELVSLLEDEKLAFAYKEAIKKITYKDRTRKEIYDILMDKTSLEAKQMNDVIDILEKQGLINDRKYIEDAIASLKDKLMGRHKVILHLRKHGIPAHLIDEYLSEDDILDESKQALLLANQIKDVISEPSVNGKKDKIRMRLINRGFDYGIVGNVVSQLDFSEELAMEEENCREFAKKTQEQIRKRKLKDKRTNRKKLMKAVVNKGFELELARKIVTELEGEFTLENNQ